jgi:hypothetical protein
MKNIPKKCPVCKGKLILNDIYSGFEAGGPRLECEELLCFIAHVLNGKIDWWRATLTIDGFNEWDVVSSLPDALHPEAFTVLRDQDANEVLRLPEWHPYKTRTFLKDTTKLLERLLNLKAFF